ncbi:MAG: DNA primase [Candidatus Taylorbacteria bacterium RIFCSPLOWO2_01_FULL_44_26]|uniref:DNA primase n=1 Tax=Candidatus Taylorbacteria bacterium RIFCSPLOWO2_01_FULL_44_26 TaxID=1802318 RepID=A0A1G2N5N4_9BACT|nr:MAG: DNA primase [Candidatus Taylorbacteria bacterium RIFCSPLOWO2_01_FULL_44_26]
MDSQIEEIKNKLNVIDVVGSYVKLTKTGVNYRGVCPFHAEKSPSFFVNPGRQLWHCFGCGAGSSIFDFVMKIEGVEFGDALRILANKAGVELKRENPQIRTERQRLYEICELACSFFEKQLEGSAMGKEAKAYLLKRGITSESIKKWRLGYSPDTWNGLTDFLISKGYKREEVVKAGLAIAKENKNDSYDRFRGRLIFPVFGLNSEVLGFGGRVFKQANEKETAKYINTPQTMLYDKSGILYGLNNAKLAVRKQNQCVVTEGYTDVIMCHQAGFENTVASSGTALTTKHLAILKRYSENLVLAFDMDIAGDSATKRGINNAQELGFNIKIIESYGQDASEAGSAGSPVSRKEKKSDPAEIILKDPGIWKDSVDKAKGIMDYYFDSAFSHFDKSNPEGKKEIGKIVLPVIKRLQNKIEQGYWIQKLSEMLGIKEEAIVEELVKIKETSPAEKQEVFQTAQPMSDGSAGQRKKLIEEKVVSLIFKNPNYIKIIAKPQYDLFSSQIRNFLEMVEKLVEKNIDEKLLENDLKLALTDISPDKEFNNFLAALALRGDAEFQEDGEAEIALCLLQLKNIELKNKLNNISEEIKKAETQNDQQKVNALIEEFNTLTKEL